MPTRIAQRRYTIATRPLITRRPSVADYLEQLQQNRNVTQVCSQQARSSFFSLGRHPSNSVCVTTEPTECAQNVVQATPTAVASVEPADPATQALPVGLPYQAVHAEPTEMAENCVQVTHVAVEGAESAKQAAHDEPTEMAENFVQITHAVVEPAESAVKVGATEWAESPSCCLM